MPCTDIPGLVPGCKLSPHNVNNPESNFDVLLALLNGCSDPFPELVFVSEHQFPTHIFSFCAFFVLSCVMQFFIYSQSTVLFFVSCFLSVTKLYFMSDDVT